MVSNFIQSTDNNNHQSLLPLTVNDVDLNAMLITIFPFQGEKFVETMNLKLCLVICAEQTLQCR